MLWKNLCFIIVLVSLKTNSNAGLKYSNQGKSQSLFHSPGCWAGEMAHWVKYLPQEDED